MSKWSLGWGRVLVLVGFGGGGDCQGAWGGGGCSARERVLFIETDAVLSVLTLWKHEMPPEVSVKQIKNTLSGGVSGACIWHDATCPTPRPFPSPPIVHYPAPLQLCAIKPEMELDKQTRLYTPDLRTARKMSQTVMFRQI